MVFDPPQMPQILAWYQLGWSFSHLNRMNYPAGSQEINRKRCKTSQSQASCGSCEKPLLPRCRCLECGERQLSCPATSDLSLARWRLPWSCWPTCRKGSRASRIPLPSPPSSPKKHHQTHRVQPRTRVSPRSSSRKPSIPWKT